VGLSGIKKLHAAFIRGPFFFRPTYTGFLSRLVALSNSMRLSLKKAAHAVLSDAEIRVRWGERGGPSVTRTASVVAGRECPERSFTAQKNAPASWGLGAVSISISFCACFRCLGSITKSLILYPDGVYARGKVGKMSHHTKEKQKLIARIKRIRGQVDAIERSLTIDEQCADVLMLLANVRGGINSLMAEVLEDHIRLHMMSPEKSPLPPTELAEDLIDLVRAYLK
jgi:DNA-binding FrmR family transcriptional regulator